MVFLKSKGILVGVGILIIASIIIFFSVFPKGTSTQKQAPEKTKVEEMQSIKQLSATDIGLTLTLRSDKKAINMVIANLSGIQSIEYEATYDVEVKDGKDTLKVPRGIGPSTIELTSADKQIIRELELGTCSKNVCKYDKVVSDITFLIKVNFQNGDVGSVEQKVQL